MERNTVVGLCVLSLMVGGWLSSALTADPEPTVITKTVTETKTVIEERQVQNNTVPAACLEMTDLLRERNEINTRYQEQIVSPMEPVLARQASIGLGGRDPQIQIKEIRDELQKIKRANVIIQKDFAANKTALASAEKRCREATR